MIGLDHSGFLIFFYWTESMSVGPSESMSFHRAMRERRLAMGLALSCLGLMALTMPYVRRSSRPTELAFFSNPHKELVSSCLRLGSPAYTEAKSSNLHFADVFQAALIEVCKRGSDDCADDSVCWGTTCGCLGQGQRC
jgi:hypothetical protein